MKTLTGGHFPSWATRRAVTIHAFLAGGLLVGLAAVMWWQPILADEWDFYRAATRWSQDRGLIPHPHAYVHLSQLCFLLFGQSVGSARLIGVFTALVNLALIPRLVYAFFDRGAVSRRIAIGAIWLYALNPMTVQNMMLLDIDNTLLVSVLLGALWLWSSVQDGPALRRVAALGVAFAIALWVKLPTPPLLLGCILAFHLVRGEFRRVLELIPAAIVAGAVFFLSFTLYSRLTGFTLELFGPTLGSAPGRLGNIEAMLLRFPQGMGVLVMWLSLPLTALLLVVVVGTVRRLFKRQIEDRDLLVVYVVAVVLFYVLVIPPAWGYPRYQAPVIPAVAILVAVLVVPALHALPRRALVVVVGLGVAAFVYNLVVVGDPLWSLYALTFETGVGELHHRLSQGMGDVLRLAIPISAALAIACLFALRWRIRLLLMVACTLGTLSFAHTASTTAIQVPADYSTRYRYTYGYDDLFQTIDALKRTNGYVIAVKDVLYYTGLPGEEIYDYVCPGCSPQWLIERVHTTRVDALAWTTKEDNRSSDVVKNPALMQTLDACYTRVTHGVFIVYLRRPDGPCP